MPDAGWPSLDECEELIEATDELVWRQIHPNNVDRGIVSSGGFAGTEEDRYRVSGARGATTTAEAAFEFHTSELGLKSAGTWAITTTQADQAGCRSIDDSECLDVETPGHCYIDLRGLPKAEQRKARAELASAATARGRQHPADET